MKPGPAGLVSDPQFVARLQAALPDVAFAVFTCEPAIDSSSATPAAWQRLADAVATRREDYRGFVILHGTDTLAYSAAALSEMLRGLGRAVVLTGSQIPLGQPESDALRNVRGALAFAAMDAVQQTAVFFYDRLLRSDAVRKLDAQSFAAFDSPNADWLGMFDGEMATLSAPLFEEGEESAFVRRLARLSGRSGRQSFGDAGNAGICVRAAFGGYAAARPGAFELRRRQFAGSRRFASGVAGGDGARGMRGECQPVLARRGCRAQLCGRRGASWCAQWRSDDAGSGLCPPALSARGKRCATHAALVA